MFEEGDRVWVAGVFDMGTLHNPLGVVTDVDHERETVRVKFDRRDWSLTFPREDVQTMDEY